MSMNEEKEKMWFVWEMSNTAGRLQPALYRGMPKTGMGTTADDERFKFKIELDAQEAKIDDLVKLYPCPVPQDTLKAPNPKHDLSSSEVTREQKAFHLGLTGVKGQDQKDILDKMYPKKTV